MFDWADGCHIVNNVLYVKEKGGLSPSLSLVKFAVRLLLFHCNALLIEHRFEFGANLLYIDGRTEFVHLYDDGFFYHDFAVVVLVDAFAACDGGTVYPVVDKDAIHKIVRRNRFNDLALAVFVVEANVKAVFGSHGLPFVRCLPYLTRE